MESEPSSLCAAPFPGSTFDRCLEEILRQQYGLAVMRHPDVTRDEQSLLPNSEKHSLFISLCLLLRVPPAQRASAQQVCAPPPPVKE